MVVTHSVRIAPGRYLAPAGDSGAITVRGSNITVDLRGVELIGSNNRHNPDTFAGIAIRIEGGKQVTVRGARIRGFKVGIIARGVTIALDDNDVSATGAQRLYAASRRRAWSTGCRTTTTRRTSGCATAPAIYLADMTRAR